MELRAAFPDADFYFHKAGKEFPGMLEDYDAGKCKVMAVGYEDTSLDTNFLNQLCKRNLVYTDSVIAEIPIAFPIRSEYVAGFSHWLYTGDRNGDASLQASKDLFFEDVSCDVNFDDEVAEEGEYAKIQVKNSKSPLCVLKIFLLVSLVFLILSPLSGFVASVLPNHVLHGLCNCCNHTAACPHVERQARE